MGSEEEAEAQAREEARRRRSTTPQKQQLSLFSLPVPQQSPDPPGMLTPPLRCPGSVPFCWEEAPGKPLFITSNSPSATTPRCLELPPRLQLTESSKSNTTPSPTTVLDGPYNVGRSSSFTSSSFGRDPLSLLGSFRRGTAGRSSYYDSDGSGKKASSSSSSSSSSSNSKLNQDVDEGTFVISHSSSSSAAAAVLVGIGLGEVGGGGGGTKGSKVKIMNRCKTIGSFFSLPRTKSSHLWASIYDGFKQMVPWQRKTTKKDGLVA